MKTHLKYISGNIRQSGYNKEENSQWALWLEEASGYAGILFGLLDHHSGGEGMALKGAKER